MFRLRNDLLQCARLKFFIPQQAPRQKHHCSYSLSSPAFSAVFDFASFASFAVERLEFLFMENALMPMPEFKQLVDEVKKEIHEISQDKLKQMQHSGEDFVLIDVREKEDSSQGMIPGAVPVPRGVLELNIDQVTTDKDRKIVCYCGGGSRSALAAYMLQRMGFKNVMSLMGGYRGWKDSGK